MYKIKVRQYMMKKATPDFDFMLKWNNDEPMPMRIMVGDVLEETRGMVKMSLHADITEKVTPVCMRCGKPITNPISQYFGMGPECGGHNYVNPFNNEEELQQAVAEYREKLNKIEWTGWIIRSAIEECIDLDANTEKETVSKNASNCSNKTIKVRVDKSIRAFTDNALFVSFEYDNDIINIIRGCRSRYWHKTLKEWELPDTELGFIKSRFNNYDLQIEGEVKKEKPIAYIPDGYKFKTEPFEHQIEGFNYGLAHKKWLLGDEQGLGKALALDTKIYTPTGFKTIQDIKVGDFVFGKNGKPTKVSAVYNHKNVEMYRFTFSDGVTIDCCKDHLWEINDQHGKKVVDTNWFLSKDQFGKVRKDNLKDKYVYKYYIDRCKPLQFNHRDVYLHPYVLGALLGDGSLTTHCIKFTTADVELEEKINKLLPTGYKLHKSKSLQNTYDNVIVKENTKSSKINEVRKYLDSLNLMFTNSHTKFIPDIYLYNDVDSRIALLQGLIDTDGYCTEDNLIQYTSVSKQLIEDVRFLCESLGAICNISENDIAYTLTIRTDNPHLFASLSRKKEVLQERKFRPRRNIIKIERIENADAKCITVDNEDSLYVIEHCVITHNTKQVIDIAMAKKLQKGYKHCLIICGVNGLKWNWLNEIATHSNEKGWILGQKTTKNGITIGSNLDKLKDLQINLDSLPYFLITNVESLREEGISNTIKVLCEDKTIGIVAIDEIHKCFDYDTLIQTDQGLLKIGDIVENHIDCKALSYNENSELFEYKSIVDYHKNLINKPLLTLEFDNGTTIKCTADHLFFTKNRGWVKAENLTEFDDLIDSTLHS